MKKKKTYYYGGQAVMEGVMMMGPKDYAIACRKPNGEIILKKEETNSVKNRFPFLKWPIIRGFVNLIEMLILGMSTLTWSANQQVDEEEEEEDLTPKEIAATIGIALVFVVGLFFILPAWLGTIVYENFGGFARSLVEGVLRIGILILYVWAISRMKEIQRVFEYHGAEHKTIAAYEAGAVLTPTNVKKYTRFHRRCGTSFLLMVMIVMVILFTFVGQTDTVWARVLIKLACTPFVAGVTYEINRYAATHCGNPLVRALTVPGLWLQRLTTAEPDESQIETAIVALKSAMAEDDFTNLREREGDEAYVLSYIDEKTEETLEI